MLRKSIFLLSTAALLACCININPSSVEAKGKGHRGAYLVPPPPAYAPSILPASVARNSGLIAYSREVVPEATESTDAANAEAKPVHIKVYGPSSQIIKPTASRKGVSFYN